MAPDGIRAPGLKSACAARRIACLSLIFLPAF
jgi:hypothetical protein